jgi:hemerythrin-like domain-containing protein
MNRALIHDALQLLVDEHHEITAFLDMFEKFARALADETNDLEPSKELRKYVDYLKCLADMKHHEKEESILFVAMVEHGFSVDSGPICAMTQEHDMLRQQVQILDQFASKCEDLSAGDLSTIVDTILNYCERLRSHIDKENNVLFPTINLQVPSSALDDVLEQFCSLDREFESKCDSQQIKSNLVEFPGSNSFTARNSPGEKTMTNPQLKPDYDYFFCDECKTHIPCQRVAPGKWVVECPYCDGECFSCKTCTLTEGCFGKGGDMDMVIKKPL